MPVSRAQEQALKELKLNGKYFTSLLLPMAEADGDFDVYLMENDVMPVLLQGLDALSRHVDKLASGKSDASSARKQKFNPLTWLAQYLLRNHPTHSSDHRDELYRHLRELASMPSVDTGGVERGRRNLLRRLPEFETTWQLFTHGDGLSTSQIEQVFQQLDTLWNMDGQFIRSLPANFAARIPCADPNKVTFNEFWTFFEEIVSTHDLIRLSELYGVFENAEKRRQMAEQEAQDALERQRQREANIAEEERQQRLLKAQFETLCADAYLNPELNQIMIKGAVLAYPMDLKGEHIVLILQLLRAWGHSLLDTEGKYMEQDEWDEHTKELWIGWRKLHGPQTNYPGVVDAESLKVLTDKEAFQAFHHIEE